MTSNICCTFPGLSTESRVRRTMNKTTMIAATRICMVMKLAQGRACAGKTKIPSSALPRPARLSLKSLVSQISCASISDQLIQDFDDNCGRRHKKTHQSGRQTDLGKPQYNIAGRGQQEVAQPEHNG